MKSFGLLVSIMVMFILLSGKIYSQSIDCDIHDIDDCDIHALEQPNIPPTEKCCNAFKQHIACICYYAQFFFKIGDVVRGGCHINWHGICPLFSK